MRFYGFALAASAIVLGACAGGDSNAGDTTAVGVDTTATPATATPGTTPTPATGGTATMAAITGTTHEVKMVGDAQGYRFEPANITVKAGDGIKFTMVSGGPHNVAFDPATVPADVQAQLDANISEKMGQLSSAMKMNAGESITVSFANIKPGNYPFNCTPHLAMNMKGTVTVQ
ncbi:MAG TPA: plastocyanin/azurin family copper-binding protein [Gemmatimonadaceae bacterium]|nr:plastocyanin/azurin family copper-binding protein [Gemmatimonadaceae bacterium]